MVFLVLKMKGLTHSPASSYNEKTKDCLMRDILIQKANKDFRMHKNKIKNQIQAKIKACKTALPALYKAFKDPRTPNLARFLCFLTVGYALSPMDLIPDFIPILGALDDLLLLPLMITAAIKLIPAEVWQECQAQAQALPPKQLRYAVPIALFWLAVLLLLLKGFIRQ